MFIVEAMIREDFDMALELISEYDDVSYTFERDVYTYVINVNTKADKDRHCEIRLKRVGTKSLVLCVAYVKPRDKNPASTLHLPNL